MKKFSACEYANPSSWYKEGISAKNALDEGRKKIADFIHAHPDEMIFTSGGTESNNLAIIGAVESLHEKGVEYDKMHVIVSIIEHSSVRECVNYLNGKGVSIDAIAVENNGVVSLDELKKKIKTNTVIVSVMTVNNEIGTIQPIKEIAKIIRDARRMKQEARSNKELKQLGEERENNSDPFSFQDFNYPILHTDASQAALYEDLNVEKLGVDLLTLDGTKVYGPRGVGALFIKRGVPISSIIHGGGQESGMRSGTENIPAIMGFAKALEIAGTVRNSEKIKVNELRDYFYKELKGICKDIEINPRVSSDVKSGENLLNKSTTKTQINSISKAYQSPHILNVSIPKIDGEFFVMKLDAKGIACSTKSSCLRDEDESYVLKSIGVNSKLSIRFSFGRWSKKGELKRAVKIIGDALRK
jgi:cysteine desulfurase